MNQIEELEKCLKDVVEQANNNIVNLNCVAYYFAYFATGKDKFDTTGKHSNVDTFVDDCMKATEESCINRGYLFDEQLSREFAQTMLDIYTSEE